jgi:lysophospholipase L1-like esterase
VIILCGTNDLWWDLDVNLIQANIFAMACQAQHNGILPIVGLPPPLLMQHIRSQEMMPPVAGWKKCVNQLVDLVRVLTLSAHQSDIVSLDFHQPFIDGNGAARTRYYREDGLHPNARGHRLMADTAVEVLHSRFHFK